jgi:hypothetical protein
MFLACNYSKIVCYTPVYLRGIRVWLTFGRRFAELVSPCKGPLVSELLIQTVLAYILCVCVCVVCVVRGACGECVGVHFNNADIVIIIIIIETLPKFTCVQNTAVHKSVHNYAAKFVKLLQSTAVRLAMCHLSHCA